VNSSCVFYPTTTYNLFSYNIKKKNCLLRYDAPTETWTPDKTQTLRRLVDTNYNLKNNTI
jgi:hypothetical protein